MLSLDTMPVWYKQVQVLEPVGLPGYAWDARAQQYRNLTTGRFVAQSKIMNLMETVVDRSTDTIEVLAERAHAGQITPRQFYELARRELRHATNATTALAKGGFHQMTQRDWGRVGGHLARQYRSLRGFADALDPAKGAAQITLAQTRARARSYFSAIRTAFYRTRQLGMKLLGKKEERWITAGDDRVCETCRGLEQQAWQPIGSLPLPGQTHPACRCDKKYR